jgi:UDP-N-acetylmuramoyl-tripeptide--D-alanyl-D-alanine ligase
MTAPLWTGDALALAAGGRATRPFEAAGISIDTRTLRPGDLFVALTGENRDGHVFAAEALARGAAGVLVSRSDGLPANAPLVIVDDTLRALHALGAAGRARFGGRVVAVTGSVGKTTTKEMLRAALSAFGPVHAAEASYNNHWGVPLTLARLPEDAAFCVAEIGMNQPGEILPLARLARPHVAVITAIGTAHIGHLGNEAAIADEKASLLRGLEPGGIAVLPADSPMLGRLLAAAASGGEARLFGSGAENHLLDVTSDGRTTRATALVGGSRVAFRLAAPGRHMATNALAALTAATALGLDPARAVAALDGFVPIAGRGAQRVINGDILLLDESYNASGDSVRAALDVLRMQAPRRRVAVLGDMRELGDRGPGEHRGLATDVAASADLLYACGPLTRHLYDAVPATLRAAFAPDAASLAPLVAAEIRPGDAVLVKGSLGSQMRLVVEALGACAPGAALEGAG